MKNTSHRLKLIDSHTAGEATRVVVSGVPDLAPMSLQQQREVFAKNHDWIRTTILSEPRGHSAMVGAILTKPVTKDAVAGVVFCNNSGYLGMCIHGTIGLAKTLQSQGKISLGSHLIDTPAGMVTVHLHDDGQISVDNVPCYRHAVNVKLNTPSFGSFCGDVAWGGNWFFITNNRDLSIEYANLNQLKQACEQIRQALEEARITGKNNEPVDHVELSCASPEQSFHSKNFVFCPGNEYDRSPCGTGTSAKLACLFAENKLAIGQRWVQASILGTAFDCSIKEVIGNKIVPTICSQAFITGETQIMIDPDDPFKYGLNPT